MRAYQESRGAPPALREIGEHFGIASTNGVSDHLSALHRKGLIRKHRGEPDVEITSSCGGLPAVVLGGHRLYARPPT